MRRRLLYALRLLQNNPASLLALIQFEHKGKRIPWAIQLHDDLQNLFKRSRIFQSLGDPILCADAWAKFMRTNPAVWKDEVAQVFFTPSVLDKQYNNIESGPTSLHVCNQCSDRPAFQSGKALASHMRAKHGMRCIARNFIGADAICPICKTNFVQRIRGIAHLSDSRRTKCWDQIVVQKIVPIPAPEVDKLDLLDKAARLEAQKIGHSHALSKGQAKRANGTCIGRVTS